MGQDGIMCDDVDYWSGFNKCGDWIDNVDIGLCNIVEGMRTNNQVSPTNLYPIISTIILVDVGRIL